MRHTLWILILLFALIGPASAIPALPAEFSGTVTIDGNPGLSSARWASKVPFPSTLPVLLMARSRCPGAPCDNGSPGDPHFALVTVFILPAEEAPATMTVRLIDPILTFGPVVPVVTA